MKYTVYKITNKLDDKIYIGKHQTMDPNDDYMGSGKRLGYAKKKYGVENFEKEVLFVYDNEDEMNVKEAELVTEEFCDREDTYNICPGGQGGWGYVNQHGLNATEEARKKVSLKAKKQMKELHSCPMKGPLQRRGLIRGTAGRKNPFEGRKHTQESLQKMRKSKNVGSSNSQYGTIWITDGEKNTKIRKNDDIPEGWYRGRK